MFFKVIVIILFLFAVASLFAGLYFLLKDDADSEHKRTMFALMSRVGFCILALMVLIYALISGKLGMNPAPAELGISAEPSWQWMKYPS